MTTQCGGQELMPQPSAHKAAPQAVLRHAQGSLVCSGGLLPFGDAFEAVFCARGGDAVLADPAASA